MSLCRVANRYGLLKEHSLGLTGRFLNVGYLQPVCLESCQVPRAYGRQTVFWVGGPIRSGPLIRVCLGDLVLEELRGRAGGGSK